MHINPPLLNSACPWATTPTDLRSLLLCPSTGAVTIRTSELHGFQHNPHHHRFVLFDPATCQAGSTGTHSVPELPDHPPNAQRDEDARFAASLNNLGYSPVSLPEYLSILADLSATFVAEGRPTTKRVIISVAGGADDVRACYETIRAARGIAFPLAVEINLSCPNMPGAPPVAYDDPAGSLAEYLLAALPGDSASASDVPIGIKTPPYTHAGQYASLGRTLLTPGIATHLSFLTSTNTLGSCLLRGSQDDGPVLPGDGIGGMAGAPLHPLSLGNVASIRAILDGHAELAHIRLIGVGGVSDGDGYKRMRGAGADAVALATALGRRGVEVFGEIERDIGGW